MKFCYVYQKLQVSQSITTKLLHNLLFVISRDYNMSTVSIPQTIPWHINTQTYESRFSPWIAFRNGGGSSPTIFFCVVVKKKL